jgi:hypothetical protein
VRPWADDAHTSKQHINKLWKFIDVGSAEEPAKPCYSFIVFLGLFFVGFIVYNHRSKFQTRENATTSTRPTLNKKNGSA